MQSVGLFGNEMNSLLDSDYYGSVRYQWESKLYDFLNKTNQVIYNSTVENTFRLGEPEAYK